MIYSLSSLCRSFSLPPSVSLSPSISISLFLHFTSSLSLSSYRLSVKTELALKRAVVSCMDLISDAVASGISYLLITYYLSFNLSFTSSLYFFLCLSPFPTVSQSISVLLSFIIFACFSCCLCLSLYQSFCFTLSSSSSFFIPHSLSLSLSLSPSLCLPLSVSLYLSLSLTLFLSLSFSLSLSL